jgi:nucleoid-associated protein YgaU
MTWRTTASIRLLVIISLIAMILLLLASSVGAGQVADATVEHRVVSGETLWDIAGDYTPNGESVRRTVSEIRRLSSIDGSTIHPGQVLTVPILEIG